MYTEDGFELRPVGETIEIYASGEIFHEDAPPIIAAFKTFTSQFKIRKVLCDVRLASYILEQGEAEQRAISTGATLTPFPTAFVCLSSQQGIIQLTIDCIRRAGGQAEMFSNKAEARDWLAGVEDAGKADAAPMPRSSDEPRGWWKWARRA
jgi:hypothetical protein